MENLIAARVGQHLLAGIKMFTDTRSINLLAAAWAATCGYEAIILEMDAQEIRDRVEAHYGIADVVVVNNKNEYASLYDIIESMSKENRTKPYRVIGPITRLGAYNAKYKVKRLHNIDKSRLAHNPQMALELQ